MLLVYLASLVLCSVALMDPNAPDYLFYPFGEDVGDSTVNKDDTPIVYFRDIVRFGNSAYRSFSISLNGVIVVGYWDKQRVGSVEKSSLKTSTARSATTEAASPEWWSTEAEDREIWQTESDNLESSTTDPVNPDSWSSETDNMETWDDDNATVIPGSSLETNVNPRSWTTETDNMETWDADNATVIPGSSMETNVNPRSLTTETDNMKKWDADHATVIPGSTLETSVNPRSRTTEHYEFFSRYINPRIIPFLCEVEIAETGTDGRIYHRSITDETLLLRAAIDVQANFPGAYPGFKPRLLYVVTWYKVSNGEAKKYNQTNTFQLVLMTDFVDSFIMYNYGSMNYFNSSCSFPTLLPNSNGRCLSGFYLPRRRGNQDLDTDGYQNVIYPDESLKNCRRMFHVGHKITESKSTCKIHGVCETYQQFDRKTKTCVDVAPSFDSPMLEGPFVVGRRWVVFHCSIPSKETRKEAAFNVTFLFNNQPDHRVPSAVIHPPEFKATLHEKYLTNKHLGKWISCAVSTYWINSHHSVQSHSLISHNNYWIGIEVSPKQISLFEDAHEPVRLTIKSTIPITCGLSSIRTENEDECGLMLRIKSTDNVLIRGKCHHILRESDWRKNERKAYNQDDQVEIFARIDPFYFWRRSYTLTIDIDPLPDRITEENEKFRSMWSKHKIADIMVYHYDSYQGACWSTGDPHVSTFNYFWYTIYPSGQFTYVQTTHGKPIEVQVRHKPCGPGVSCVCGVAMREGDLILAADMCGDDGRIHYITYNDDLEGAEIRQGYGGWSFEIILPSKVTALVYVNTWGFNLIIYVTSSEYRRIEGLCGSFDEIWYKRLTLKGSKAFAKSVDEAVESWRVPLGQSLFDGIKSKLSDSTAPVNDRREGKFCPCTDDDRPCSSSRADAMPSANELNKIVVPKRRFERNTLSRKRRDANQNSTSRLTDDIDYEYDSSAFSFTEPQPSPDMSNGSWPTDNRITEARAREHCSGVLWNDLPIRTLCEKSVNMTGVDAVIDKCITDIKLTDDLSWADDKLSEVQNLCVFEMITTINNATESNATERTVDLLAEIQGMKALVCLPQNCSGHGTCVNGTCICSTGFIGSDCALPENAVPKIVRKIGPKSCDLENALCQKIELLTLNVTESRNLTCKIGIRKMDESQSEVITSGSLETMQTTSCKLPTDGLNTRFLPVDVDATEEIEFDSVALGSPVLHYTVSISNNRIDFSRPLPFVVYDSKCISCDKEHCDKKTDACLIRGYCFTKYQRNPLRPECERCDPLISSAAWSKIPGTNAYCGSCSASLCPENEICAQMSRGRFKCRPRSFADDAKGFAVVVVVTVVAVVLTVVVVFVIIRHC